MNKYAILDELNEMGIGFKPLKTEDEIIGAINRFDYNVHMDQSSYDNSWQVWIFKHAKNGSIVDYAQTDYHDNRFDALTEAAIMVIRSENE
jgi:hypothetical protein